MAYWYGLWKEYNYNLLREHWYSPCLKPSGYYLRNIHRSFEILYTMKTILLWSVSNIFISRINKIRKVLLNIIIWIKKYQELKKS